MDLKLPGEEKKKRDVPFTRVAIWIIVGGFAVWMIVSGVYQGISKGAF